LLQIAAARKEGSGFLFRDRSRFWFLVSVRYGFVKYSLGPNEYVILVSREISHCKF
jgi:hypothetical protein